MNTFAQFTITHGEHGVRSINVHVFSDLSKEEAEKHLAAIIEMLTPDKTERIIHRIKDPRVDSERDYEKEVNVHLGRARFVTIPPNVAPQAGYQEAVDSLFVQSVSVNN
jgi:hypothetical protein